MSPPPPEHSSAKSSLRTDLIVPACVLVLCLAVSLAASLLLHSEQVATIDKRVARPIDYSLKLLRNRFEVQNATVLSAAAAASAGMRVDRLSWAAFNSGLAVAGLSAGTQGLSFAYLVPASELDAYIRSQSAEPHFKFRPDGVRPAYLPLVYVEPRMPLNTAALGFDLLSEPQRATAVFAARDSGATAMTGKLRLANNLAGFDIFAAVYTPGVPVSTVAQRRAAFRGIVCDAFIAGPLFQDLFAVAKPNLEVEVFAGPKADKAFLIFSNRTGNEAGLVTEVVPFKNTPGPWTIVFHSSRELDASIRSASHMLWLALTGSALLSLLCATFAWQLTAGRRRAVAAASRATHLLHEGEARFQSILQGVTDYAIITLDTSGCICTWNAGAEVLFGYKEDEVIGKPTAILDPPEARHSGTSLMQRSSFLGRATYEDTRVRKDGAPFLARITLNPVHDSSGHLVGFAKLVLDVSSTRAAERQLARNEQRLRDAQELAGMGSWEFDFRSGQGQACPQAALFMGLASPDGRYTMQELLANIPEEDLTIVTGALDSALHGDSDETFEMIHRFRQQSGSLIWVHGRSRVVRDASGQVVSAFGTILDITALKAAEAAKLAHARAEKRIKHIVETIREVVFEIDVNHNWVFLNPAWTRFTGFTVSESLQQPVTNWIEPSQHREFARHFLRLIKGNLPLLRSEVLGKCKTGDYRWMEVIAEVADNGPNGERRIVGTLVDIHDRKQAAEALKLASQAAEEANRGKSEFLAILSRELRLPLGGIVGMSKVLCNAKLTNQERETALAVRQSAQDLLGVLNSLLDLSRLEAGLTRLSPIPVDLRLATEDVIERFSLKADQRHLDLSFVCHPAIPKRVLTDPGRYRQLLSILIDNAISYTNRGQVAVALTAVRIAHSVIDLEIEIRDTGSGLVPEEAFAATNYFGSRGAGGRQGKRLGLGLALARELVTFLNGKATVSSKPGTGSRVTVTIECQREEHEWPPPQPPISLENCKILVVEPSISIHAGIQSLLSGSGAQIAQAFDSQSALELLASQAKFGSAFNAVLYSTETAGLDWEEFGDYMRANSRYANASRILLARSTNLPGRSELNRVGYSDALRRNPSRQQLWAALESALQDSAQHVTHTPTLAREAQAGRIPSSGKCVLVVTDPHADVEGLQCKLDETGCSHSVARSLPEIFGQAQRRRVDLVLLDGAIPEAALNDFARRLRSNSSTANLPLALLAAAAAETDFYRGAEEPPVEDIIARDFTSADLLALLEKLNADRISLNSCFDQKVALSRCGDDWDLVGELAQDFREHVAQISVSLIKAAALCDSVTAANCLASLKSGASFFGATQLSQVLDEVTDLVDLHDWAAVPRAFSTARIELNRLCDELPRSSPTEIVEVIPC